jgi:hypothetical protein
VVEGNRDNNEEGACDGSWFDFRGAVVEAGAVNLLISLALKVFKFNVITEVEGLTLLFE